MAKIETILEKLHQLSEEGKIPWKLTVDPSTFSVVLGESSAHVSKDMQGTYHFKLLNSSGDDLDHVFHSRGIPGDRRIAELYEIAGCVALVCLRILANLERNTTPAR